MYFTEQTTVITRQHLIAGRASHPGTRASRPRAWRGSRGGAGAFVGLVQFIRATDSCGVGHCIKIVNASFFLLHLNPLCRQVLVCRVQLSVLLVAMMRWQGRQVKKGQRARVSPAECNWGLSTHSDANRTDDSWYPSERYSLW